MIKSNQAAAINPAMIKSKITFRAPCRDTNTKEEFP